MNFYRQAETILDKLLRREGTIKSLTLGDDSVKDKRRMYALVCETLKYKEALNVVIDSSKLLQVEKKLPRTLAFLLVHDLLFTKRGIQSSDGPLKQAILRHQTRLKAELVKTKIKLRVKRDEELVSQKVRDAVHIPRYVRVNEHRMTVDKVLEQFQKEGYILEDTKEDLTGLSPKTIRRDYHLPDLLVFPPNTDLHDHPLYLSGNIILQDKASCFPAHVCRPLPQAYVIDACAAPGNKTSHLSALMCNTGRIWAFDLDKRRLELLSKLTGRAGCENIIPMHRSFLEAEPNDPQFAKVEYLLLDPSCSGSGIISRLDYLVDGDEHETTGEDGKLSQHEERLKSLAEFQVSVVLHAMKFPAAKRIVYSTCSVHPQENEHVVRTVLASTKDFELADQSQCIPTWRRRGLVEECGGNQAMANCMVRTSPSEDFTNGFFVVCFVRKATVGLNSTEFNSNEAHKKKRRTRPSNAGDVHNKQNKEDSIVIDEAEMGTSGTKRRKKKKRKKLGKEKGGL